MVRGEGVQLRRDDWPVNRKRIQWLWRAEGLWVRLSPPQRSRLGTSTSGTDRLAAQHPNHVWAVDLLSTPPRMDGPVQVLSMCDEFTWESVGGKVARSITTDDMAGILGLVGVLGGLPKYNYCDKGPELIAAPIRDWCRFSATGAAYIDLGPPWQNPYMESFNSRARDGLFARAIFHSNMEAGTPYDDWRHDYNTHRSGSALKWLPPAQRARRWSPATIQ